jgi:hypothetical protein
MDVEISRTRKVTILGLDKRSVDNVAYCAATFGAGRLYWIEGILLCLEVYEKSFEHEMRTKEFPVSQICYADLPKYEKMLEIDKSFQIPVVNVSEMRIFQRILEAIKQNEKQSARNPTAP